MGNRISRKHFDSWDYKAEALYCKYPRIYVAIFHFGSNVYECYFDIWKNIIRINLEDTGGNLLIQFMM
jgi:hypothetical protein